jgi:hypothetical protein
MHLAERFAERVLEAAALPRARRDDLRDSCEITPEPPRFSLTCRITGSTYEREWDGSATEAMRLVDEAADGNAGLITGTRHYAWMRTQH